MQREIAGHGLLTKWIGLFAGFFLFVIGVMFSLLALAVGLGLTLVLGVWFWWRTRALRNEAHPEGPLAEVSGRGEVIEGEAVIVEESFTRVTSNRLPTSPDHH